MADRLLLRKGSLANLSDLDKQPGAISITTDVPGIYYDVSKTERIRLGDFIPVESLEKLADKARSGLSETALYYAQKENVLARYDGSKLVWINDTSDLQEDIKDLVDADTEFQNLITAIYGETIPGTPEHTIVDIAKDLSQLKKDLGEFEQNADVNIIESISAKIGNDGSELASGPDDGKKITITLPKGLSNYDSGNELSTIGDNITGNTNLIKRVYGNGGNIPASGNATVYQNAQDISTIKGDGWTSETIKGNADAIAALKGDNSNYNSATVTGNAAEIADINTELENITKIDGTIDTKVAALKGTDKDDIDDITVYGNKNAITDLKGDANTANTVLGNAKAITDLKGDANTANTVLGNAKAIADLKGTENSGTGTVLGNKAAIVDINTQLDTITGKGTTTHYSTIAAGVEAAKGYTDEEIKKLSEALSGTIASANSMTFKGTVNDASRAWWTGDVKAGDTYVIGSNDIRIDINGDASIDNNDDPCRIGDLLVASHEVTGDYPLTIREAGHNFTIDNPGWYLIRTGYDTNLENELVVENNEVFLQSYAGTDLGSVSFVAPKIVNTDDTEKAGSNIQIVTSGTEIQFNLVWVDF